MPIITDALENGRVHSLKFINKWTVDDLVKAEQWDQSLRDTAVYPKIHTIVDVSAMHGMPPNVLTVSRRTPAVTHPTAGNIVVCSAGAFTQSIANTIFKMARFTRVKFCVNYAEGLAYMKTVLDQEDGT